MLQRILVFGVLTLLCSTVAAQQDMDANSASKHEKIREGIISLLRDIDSDTGNLRNIENRVFFRAKITAVVWSIDERGARERFSALGSDLRQLLSMLTAELRRVDLSSQEGVDGNGDNVSDSIVSVPGDDELIKKRIDRVAVIAEGLAAQIARFDPEFAWEVYHQAMSGGPEDIEEYDENDVIGTEFKLIVQIAKTNPSKGLQLANESIREDFTFRDVSFLKNLFLSNPQIGIAYGEKLIKRLMVKKLDRDQFEVAAHLLEVGIDGLSDFRSGNVKYAIISQQNLMSLSSFFANAVLEIGMESDGKFLGVINELQPRKAAEISAKLNTRVTAYSRNRRNVSDDSSNTGSSEEEAANRSFLLKFEEQWNTSSEGEKAALVGDTRLSILSAPKIERKVVGLSQLAIELKKLGADEAAISIMGDAEALVNSNPRDLNEFFHNVLLGFGFVFVNEQDGYRILGRAINKYNEIMRSGLVVAEFIDLPHDIMTDGELNAESLNIALSNDFMGELGVDIEKIGFKKVFETLIQNDLTRATSLLNQIERTEVRILAKVDLLILANDLALKKTQDVATK